MISSGPHAGAAGLTEARGAGEAKVGRLREGGPRPRGTRPPFYETSREGTAGGTEAAGQLPRKPGGGD